MSLIKTGGYTLNELGSRTRQGRRTDKPELSFSDSRLWTQCAQSPPPAPGASVPATMDHTSYLELKAKLWPSFLKLPLASILSQQRDEYLMQAHAQSHG